MQIGKKKNGSAWEQKRNISKNLKCPKDREGKEKSLKLFCELFHLAGAPHRSKLADLLHCTVTLPLFAVNLAASWKPTRQEVILVKNHEGLCK